ncbi:type I restriction modification DNA specificity protein [Nitrosomonas ureae]|uniref:restriction endonuclease subunit S n=1 Tax=Nitrosomonas ureae TaxID=44577 RepID=UPI000D751B76|nr:restriction endonuclease subunit S [Nitrosomonas ureae]PXX17828.1 type I restriction modification DNA specificity protein [Nitrosomonas ureae]
MSAETPEIASDKKQNVEAPTSKTLSTTPTITIPPFEKGGLGGIPRGPGGVIPKEPEWIHHLDIWTTAETEKKSGRGRSNGNGSSVYGIKKLRELILELAVRGKLVPQDPNDEPASELLKRIQAEKAKLVAESKIKKDKPLPPISDEEKPFELPQGWEWVRFGDFVFSILSGGTPSKNNLEFWNGDIPWASVKDLNVEKFLKKTQDYITKEGLEFGSKLANKGDLLICTRMGLGKIAIAAIEVAINQDLKALKITSFLNIDYFINFYNTLKIIGSGMTVAGIKQDELLSYLVPTPPLAEQHRIVAKVDELMALCDQLETQHINAAEAHEKLVSHLLGTLTQSQSADDFSANWERIAAHFDTLFTTETSIDALKQTLLQLAVMGKLVPQDPNDEPASELLKRIQAEKAKLMAEGKIKKSKSPLTPLLPGGETGSVAATSINHTTTSLSNPPLSNSTPNPNSPPPFEKGGPGGIQRGISEEEKPFELPLGWLWVKPEEFSLKITDGEHFRPPIEERGIYFLSAKDVREDGVSLDNPLFISEETAKKALQRCNPEYGDLLIVSRGATVGRMCKVDINEKFCLLGSVILVKPTALVLSEYLSIALKSPHSFKLLINASGSTAQPAIYLKDLKEITLPLPPLSEQHRIVAKIDELMTLCDQLKSTITQASQLQKKLADAVVEQVIAS